MSVIADAVAEVQLKGAMSFAALYRFALSCIVDKWK